MGAMVCLWTAACVNPGKLAVAHTSTDTESSIVSDHWSGIVSCGRMSRSRVYGKPGFDVMWFSDGLTRELGFGQWGAGEREKVSERCMQRCLL